MLSRHIHEGDTNQAQRLQSNAFEIATLLTLPAAAALAVCSSALCTGFFVGGKFTAANGEIMAHIVIALVAGLPAYVIVKILSPGFFARSDTRTPVWTALASLTFNVFLNVVVVRRYGIVGLAAATASSASLNCLLLYIILHRRGWFHFTAALGAKIARQLLATAAMSAVLWWLVPQFAARYSGSVLERVWSISLIVGAGLAVFFTTALVVGAIDKELLAQLRRRRQPRTKADDDTLEVE